MGTFFLRPCIFAGLFFASMAAGAEGRIAVLDFELKDLTLAPYGEVELRRTASIKPLLETELEKSGFKIIRIDKKAQQQADSGFGYLFDHHDVAARLGEKYQADYVVVGRLHKPSFLFAYLMVHLVDAGSGNLIGNYISESKGTEDKLTLKAVESLAVKIRCGLPCQDCKGQP